MLFSRSAKNIFFIYTIASQPSDISRYLIALERVQSGGFRFSDLLLWQVQHDTDAASDPFYNKCATRESCIDDGVYIVSLGYRVYRCACERVQVGLIVWIGILFR